MDYMTLFSAANRDKPRFAALARAVLRQAEDLIALIPQLESGFSLAGARGIQLDAIGESFGIPPARGPDRRGLPEDYDHQAGPVPLERQQRYRQTHPG